MCLDGMERIGKIRGKMRHRQRIRPGDWVLVSLRDFQDKKCDIILKYADDEVRNLRTIGDWVLVSLRDFQDKKC